MVAVVTAVGGSAAAWFASRPGARSAIGSREAEFRDDLIVLLERAQGDADRLRAELAACRDAHLATRSRLDRLLAHYGVPFDEP
jgi:hypothetical protein